MITQSPAIVISILAVALSMGGGAYASTQLASGHSVAGRSVLPDQLLVS
jgi:hypothetical protein